MPIEYVRGPVYQSDKRDAGAEPVFLQDLIGVGWETGGLQVQIGTTIREDHTGTTVSEGIWVKMSRAQCNTLIRKIRHARDRAFGRDE